MGTKRAFDEDLQELIKHPKNLDHGIKPASFEENKFPHETFQDVGIAGESGCKYRNTDDDPESENVVTVPDMVDKEFDTNAPLPLVTGISTSEASHQADIPEFDPELARNYNKNNGGMERFLGVVVIPMPDSNSDSLTEDDEASDSRKDCECLDGGSIRCVRQHVKESRLKLRESLGVQKFVDLGMLNMGQEVACRWTEEEERIFHDVVYLNPASLGRMFWNQLSITFPSRTKKEIVSYYFNVFILHRRAVQNRSRLLEIDSDDDEWRGSYGGTSRVGIEDGVDDNQKDNDGEGEGERDFVIGPTDDSFGNQQLDPDASKKVELKSSVDMNEKKVTADEGENGHLVSEYGFQTSDGKAWDPHSLRRQQQTVLISSRHAASSKRSSGVLKMATTVSSKTKMLDCMRSCFLLFSGNLFRFPIVLSVHYFLGTRWVFDFVFDIVVGELHIQNWNLGFRFLLFWFGFQIAVQRLLLLLLNV
ncbi:hypothetical protein OSB04_021762 [Centaurea solstitialis]|uniref:Uncharacterized protein n=1 Tax=Centaurea solstitialis TaxID=347529 RepID=A0AA38SWF4_9ASTR|nr:hypothetical protein OSB04_021762 [Centaurea solstitialis]